MEGLVAGNSAIVTFFGIVKWPFQRLERWPPTIGDEKVRNLNHLAAVISLFSCQFSNFAAVKVVCFKFLKWHGSWLKFRVAKFSRAYIQLITPAHIKFSPVHPQSFSQLDSEFASPTTIQPSHWGIWTAKSQTGLAPVQQTSWLGGWVVGSRRHHLCVFGLC